jgi:hypothetical protein
MKFCYAVLALAMFFTMSIADESHYEFSIRSVGLNGDDFNQSASAFAFAYERELKDSGIVSGYVHLERAAGFSGDLDGIAYNVDVQLRANIRPESQVRFYLGGGLGETWTGGFKKDEQVEIDGTEVEVATDNNTPSYLSYHLTGGVRLFFSRAMDFGVGAEWSGGGPVSSEVPYERESVATLFIIMPVAPNP